MPSQFFSQLIALYDGHPVPLGHVDIVAVDGGATLDRVALCAVVLRSMVIEGRPLFQRVHVVAPPMPEDPAEFDLLKERFVDAWKETQPNSSGEEAAAASESISVIRPAGLEIDALRNLLGQLPPWTAVIIPEGALYRSPTAVGTPAHPPMRGDAWGRHVHALTVALENAVGASERYVIIDVGEALPARKELTELLLSVKGAVVATEDENPLDRLAIAYQQLEHWCETGEAERAFAALETEFELSDGEKAYLGLHLAYRAKMPHVVRAKLGADARALDALAPSAQLRTAWVAIACGDERSATRFLRTSIPGLRSREDLELALFVAERLGNDELVRVTGERLRAAFPSSDVLLSRRVADLVNEGRLDEAAAAAGPADGDDADFLSWLSSELGSGNPLDPEQIRAEVRSRFPHRVDTADAIVADRLLTAGNPDEALRVLLTPHPEPMDERRIRQALSLVRTAALKGQRVDEMLLLQTLETAIRSMATNPHSTHLRLDLGRTVSPDVLGLLGRALTVGAMMSVASEPKHVVDEMPASDDLPEEDDLAALLERGVEWLSARGVIALGAHALPIELIGMPADKALAGLEKLAGHQALQMAGAFDKRGLEVTLALVSAIALTSGVNRDLTILRRTIIRLAQSGKVQLARDLAENALILGGSSLKRAHLAWIAYSEAYARSGNLDEAALGLACALAVDAGRTWEELWDEGTLLFRMLRDLGFLDDARHAIALARDIAPHLGAHGALATLRLDTLELQLDVLTLAMDTRRELDDYRRVMSGAESHLREVMASGDDLGPATALLATVVSLAQSHGIEVPEEVLELRAKAARGVGPESVSFVDLITQTSPTAEQLAELTRSLERARYTDDVGFDVHKLVQFAHRLLDSPSAENPTDAAYACEMLAEQTIASHASSHATPGNASWLLDDAVAPLETAKTLADDISVVLIGRGQNAVVAVHFARGEEPTCAVQDPAVFAPARLLAWSKDFPAAYSNAASHEFYTSTAGIGLDSMPHRAVIIAPVDVQSFPVNLLNVNGELAGWAHRLASAPSLAWLRAARDTPLECAPEAKAWIPTSGQGVFDALSATAERLNPVLAHEGIVLDQNSDVPDLRGLDLALVAAHGGLDASDRFFRAISDEADAFVSPAFLARQLEHTNVVVLFVCSGGRRDPHPSASALVGLAKELLSRGCRAVVAPPWPLEIAVPPYWLPDFLRAWRAGEPVIDACFAANRAVHAQFGADPAKCLAMTVYGNPLARSVIN